MSDYNNVSMRDAPTPMRAPNAPVGPTGPAARGPNAHIVDIQFSPVGEGLRTVQDQTNAEINEIKESTKWLKEQIDILWGFAHGQTLVLEKHTKNFKEDAEDLFAEQRRQIAGLTDLVNTLQKEMQATKKQADATAVELENVKKAVGDCNTRISKLEKAGKAVSSVVSKLKKALTGAKSQEADVSELRIEIGKVDINKEKDDIEME